MDFRYAKMFTMGAACLLSMAGYTIAAEQAEKVEAGNFLEAFQQGQVKGDFRTFYFSREFDTKADWESPAIGVMLDYETASLKGFTAGVGFKTGHEVASNDNQVYKGILPAGENKTDAESYTALNHYFLKWAGMNTVATIGAQHITTPWLKGHDIRLTPKSYRGLSVVNKSIKKVELHGQYILDYMNWTGEEYQSMASGFTKDKSDDGAGLIGGIVWRAPGAIKIDLWDYYYEDVTNNMYFRAQYRPQFGDDWKFGLDLRYLNQQDTGDGIGGEIDTYNAGLVASIKGHGFSLSGHYGQTGDNVVQTPFGAQSPITMQVLVLNQRAEEKAYGAKLGYDFGRIGAKGLKGYVFYNHFDTPDDGTNAKPDADEIDLSLEYKFGGMFKNLSVRARYAMVDYASDVEGGDDVNDIRLYLTYRFATK